MDEYKNENAINNILNPSTFSNASEENQYEMLKIAAQDSKIKVGFFGRLFGTNSELVSKHITFVILIFLLLFLIADFIVEVIVFKSSMNEKISSWIISIISLGLGYLFGKR